MGHWLSSTRAGEEGGGGRSAVVFPHPPRGDGMAIPDELGGAQPLRPLQLHLLEPEDPFGMILIPWRVAMYRAGVDCRERCYRGDNLTGVDRVGWLSGYASSRCGGSPPQRQWGWRVMAARTKWAPISTLRRQRPSRFGGIVL
jgi:hypothetical protein